MCRPTPCGPSLTSSLLLFQKTTHTHTHTHRTPFGGTRRSDPILPVRTLWGCKRKPRNCHLHRVQLQYTHHKQKHTHTHTHTHHTHSTQEMWGERDIARGCPTGAGGHTGPATTHVYYYFRPVDPNLEWVEDAPGRYRCASSNASGGRISAMRSSCVLKYRRRSSTTTSRLHPRHSKTSTRASM